MKKMAFAVIAAYAVMATPLSAKEWTSTVITVKDGAATTVGTVKSCNYARTVSLARQEAEKHDGAFFNLTGADNQEACPKQSRKPKAK